VVINRVSALERLHTHEEFVVCRDLIFDFDFVVEVDAGESAICVNFYFLAFYELAGKGFFAVLVKIENDLVPTLIKF
jgi:hypothetical protein